MDVRVRKATGRSAFGFAVLLVAGACGGTGSSAASPLATPSAAAIRATAPPTTQAQVSPSAAPSPTPRCGGSALPTPATSHPSDGVRDPAGRIYFGVIVDEDEIGGQVIAPLYAVDPDGSDLTVVLDCEISRPRVSRDGRRLAFAIRMDDGSWQIATSATDGSDLRILTAFAPGDQREKTGTPDWSPDGSWLAFASNHTLWRMDADGTNARLIGPKDGFDVEPRISPDGSRLVYSHGDFTKGVTDLWIHDLATGEEYSLTPHNFRELEHPDWSPDGRWIVYNTLTDRVGQHVEQVERIPADATDAEPVMLTGDATHLAWKPAYSPDGTNVVYGCYPPPGSAPYQPGPHTGEAVCRMDSDGADPTVVVDMPDANLNHVAWGVTPP